uniref:Putative response to stress n=1 Tax=Corethrella appendiculata TaxID=1370023 RepID=U5EP77_9DIPT
MAKWGEGDPRWIVEERPDATNVNNWHWTEKNATHWSKDKLKSLFIDFKISEADCQCTVYELEKIDGEATANNRKGKLIFFYDWSLELKWRGTLKNDETTLTEGKITIPNLSEENDVDEIDIQVTINESNEISEKIKLFMYNIGRDRLRKQVAAYVKSLKEDFAKGLILPKKDDPNAATQTAIKNEKNVSNITSGFNKKISMNPIEQPKKQPDTKSVGCKLDVKTLNFAEKFQCTAKELYEALTRVDMVTAFTRGHVKLDLYKGGEFVLFGGNISGKFDEIVPNKKITQTWRYKQWPTGHYSNVVMEFEQMDDHTVLKLTQTLVPSSEAEQTTQNWNRYYFESIRQAFGFGSFLY